MVWRVVRVDGNNTTEQIPEHLVELTERFLQERLRYLMIPQSFRERSR
jgi:hypothetical protein